MSARRGRLVVDLGGTTTRVGVFVDGRLLPDPIRFPTPKPLPAGPGAENPTIEDDASVAAREEQLDLVATALESARAAHPDLQLESVGVAVGATVDGAGRIRSASMLWNRPHTGFDLAAALRRRLPGARVEVANDIAAATWRYRHLGRFGLVTISTGLAIKVFDDALPFELKLVQDRDGFGGEVGHVPVALAATGADDADEKRRLGRAAAAGDPAARAALTATDVPWCECGNAGDLCSHASGPATVRAVARRAARYPGEWEASALASSSPIGDPARVTSADIARAAQAGDPFTLEVLREATAPLALCLLQLSAQLGLRRFVVMGGFAQGVGAPWFAALRDGLGRLLPGGAWFTGWTGEDLDALVRPSDDVDDSLIGMGCYLEALEGRVRELHKPVGQGRTAVRSGPRPACGHEQFQAAIAFAGICGTDLQILRGERGCEPGVLGHECVAEVVETGAGVTDIAVGTVFAVNPNHPLDEHDKLGHNQPGVLREMATWDGHLAGRGQLVELPAKSSAALVLLEPLACTARSLAQAGPDWSGRTVLVVGAGVSGLLHVLLARQWGAERVLLANRGAERLAEAVRRGLIPADDTLGLTSGLGAELLAATGGRGVDAAVVAVSGSPGPGILEWIWPGLADGATVHLSGGFPPETVLRLPDGESRPSAPIRARQARPAVRLPGGRTVTLTGSRGADRDDFAAARRACRPEPGGGLDLAPLVSHLVSLEATPRVMAELAATGRVEGELALRVVVDLRLPGDVVRRADPADLPVLGVPG